MKWEEVFRPELGARKKKYLFLYVQAGGMTTGFAASQLDMPARDFLAEMEEGGYRVPSQPIATPRVSIAKNEDQRNST